MLPTLKRSNSNNKIYKSIYKGSRSLLLKSFLAPGNSVSPFKSELLRILFVFCQRKVFVEIYIGHGCAASAKDID